MKMSPLTLILKTMPGKIIAGTMVVLISIAVLTFLNINHVRAPEVSEGSGTGVSEESVGSATSTADSISTSTPTSTPNDMNGSGNQEPASTPIVETGLQSPIIVYLYGKHIVGGTPQTTSASKVMINPWAVLEDSRCPIDVQCIQAGRVRIGVHLLHPQDQSVLKDMVFEVGDSVDIRGMRITLLQVMPYTDAGKKIKDSQYRFTFSVSQI